MSFTEGKYTQGGVSNDLQIFRGPSDFVDLTGGAAYTAGVFGLYYFSIPAGAASHFVTDVLRFQRTGEYATAAGSQQQYGTAASVPGPSTVANTSSPLALLPYYPPLLASQMATLGNIQRGPIPKGMFLSSIDIIYQVNTTAATLAQCGVARTVFANGVAPVVSTLIPLAANGMPTAASAFPYVVNVPVTPPVTFDTVADTEGIDYVYLTAGAGGTIFFYGVVSHLTYNFN